MSHKPHASWAEVYDLSYQRSFGKFYDQLTDTTMDMISNRIHPPSKIVDFGAGTGRLSIPLAKRGYDVTAVEPCREMLNQLKVKDTHKAVDCVCSKMEDFESEARFDVALCVFTVILYLLDEESLKKSLDAAHDALRVGGMLILDIPSEEIFRGYSKRENSYERSVTLTPKSDNENIFNYREEIKVRNNNGETTSYEDEFLIRYWPFREVMGVLECVGFSLLEDLSAHFSDTGSRYYIFKKSEQQ